MTTTAISAQGTVLQVATGTGSAKTISGVSVGNPTILTATAHGFSNGDNVAIAGLTGADAAQLNGSSFTVQFVTTNTFAVNKNTTGLTITAGAGTATPTTYTAVANVKTYNGFDGVVSEIDVTNLSSTAKEFRPGLVDFGQISFEIDPDLADTGQEAMRTAYYASTVKNFKLILPASVKTASWQGFVKKFPQTGGVDQVLRSAVDIRCTGSVTWS